MANTRTPELPRKGARRNATAAPHTFSLRNRQPKLYKAPQALRMKVTDRIEVGSFTITRTLNPRGLWLCNRDGECMMTDETDLARVLSKFFNQKY